MENYKKLISKNYKKKFLNIFLKNSSKKIITYNEEKIDYKELLSKIIQINNFIKEKNLEKKTLIIQFKDRSLTLIFYLAAIFSNITICPLDPNLPKSRLNKIKKSINAYKVLKNLSLKNRLYTNTKKLNFSDHNFLITFSSGTSGDPKGIVHSTNNILGSSFSYSKLIKLNDKTRVLHCLPEFYMAGIVNTFISCIWTSSQVFIVDTFSVKSIFKLWLNIKNFKINLVYLVPSIYSMISNFSPPNARDIIKNNKIKFLSTSNNLYPNIRKTFFRKFKTKIRSCYGITEMGGPLTNEAQGNLQSDSVGKIIKGCKFKIKTIENKKILFFKSTFLCKHLLISGKKRKIQLDNQGYFNSQDTGYIKNRKIILTGREKDILKKGGELIYLKDIENVLIKCGFVEEVAAVGIQDDLSDEKLNIYIVLDSKKNLDKKVKKLIKVSEREMYKTERPDKIILLTKMPKTSSGKIIKRQLIKVDAKNKIKEIIL